MGVPLPLLTVGLADGPLDGDLRGLFEGLLEVDKEKFNMKVKNTCLLKVVPMAY